MLETFQVRPLLNNLICPLWKRMGYKKCKALREVPSQAHPQEGCIAWGMCLGHEQSGTGIHQSRGFSRWYVPGLLALRNMVWRLGSLLPHSYHHPRPGSMNQTLNSHQASLGSVRLSSSLFVRVLLVQPSFNHLPLMPNYPHQLLLSSHKEA